MEQKQQVSKRCLLSWKNLYLPWRAWHIHVWMGEQKFIAFNLYLPQWNTTLFVVMNRCSYLPLLTSGGNLSTYFAAMKRHVIPRSCNNWSFTPFTKRNLSINATARCKVCWQSSSCTWKILQSRVYGQIHSKYTFILMQIQQNEII